MTERPAATLAVTRRHHPSSVRRKLASFHRRGWSRQARRGSRFCPQSILPPDGCWRPAPLGGGLPGCQTAVLFLSTATSLPLLCRTWKRGNWGKRGIEAPGSDPMDPTAFPFFDFNRSDLSVFVHQGSVRPLLASLALLIVCDDHPWFEGLEHYHRSCDLCHNNQSH